MPRFVTMSSSSQPCTGRSCVTHGTPRCRGTSSITPRVMMPSAQCSTAPKRAPSNVISFFGVRPHEVVRRQRVAGPRVLGKRPAQREATPTAHQPGGGGALGRRDEIQRADLVVLAPAPPVAALADPAEDFLLRG